jgi:hypothetical protein
MPKQHHDAFDAYNDAFDAYRTTPNTATPSTPDA